MLTTDLDGDDEKDKGALDNLLSQLIAELCMDKKASCSMSTQSSRFFLLLDKVSSHGGIRCIGVIET